MKNLAMKLEHWRVDEEGMVWMKNRLYVPKDNNLHAEILKDHHDSPLAGHPGQHGTLNLIE